MSELFDDENWLPEEPERWRPPVYCPQCGQTETRFVRMAHEISMYTCELCAIEFEVDEGEG